MQLTANDMRYIITEAAQRLLEGVEWSRGYGRGGGLPGKSRTMNMHINQSFCAHLNSLLQTNFSYYISN